jgi:hypothetical protein
MMSGAGVAEAAGSSLTVSLDDCTSGQLQRRVLIRLPRSGRVVLSVRLNYQTEQVSHPLSHCCQLLTGRTMSQGHCLLHAGL